MIPLFEIRLKNWTDTSFTSGEIFITVLEEIGNLEEWLKQAEQLNYDEISIRKINIEDATIMVKQIKQQQEIEQIYEMFGDDLTPYPEAVEYFENNNPSDNTEIVTLNVSETVWNIIQKGQQ